MRGEPRPLSPVPVAATAPNFIVCGHGALAGTSHTPSAGHAIQNNSGLPQGSAHPFSGSLSTPGSMRAICQTIAIPRRTTMNEQDVEERRDWASDFVWVILYSILVLLVMLLWVSVPA